MTDPIGDLFTRIRNAYLAHKNDTVVPYSKMKQAIVSILNQAGYIEAVAVEGKPPQKMLRLKLRYLHRLPAISGITRLSKPGRRLYLRSSAIKPVLSGQGLAIISTSQGLMTDKQAKAKGLGGELLGKVW